MVLDKVIVIGRQLEVLQMARRIAGQLFSADSIDDSWELLDMSDAEMVVVDSSINEDKICDFLKALSKKKFDIPVVIINSCVDDSLNAKYIGLGAFDCIDGDKDLPRLSKIADSVKYPDSAGNPNRDIFFSEKCPESVGIVGKSPAMEKTLNMIRLVAQSACNPVLIIGETGTGKEMVAQAVHVLRHSSSAKFVAVNCAALTANLLESELFGHTKGSFTSADSEKTGLFELAGEGSIFLDEVSEMPLDLQAKLLRVLQEKTFRKVGGTKEIKCNATIIASSNRNLLGEVEKGNFRKDLYYRLTICPIAIAPLRHADRREDIEILAEYFVRNSQISPERSSEIKGMTKLAIEKLKKHNWPGNVRELHNVIDRAILLETTSKIGCCNLIFNPEEFAEDTSPTAATMTTDFSLEKAEKELIKRALQESNGQKTRAAAMLGITRATLYAKVKAYNINPVTSPVAVTA